MENNEFAIQPSIRITLPQQDIDDIMVTALEGGICYWCRKAEPVDGLLGAYACEQISRGGSLVLHDAESSDKWELTREKFLDGIKLFLEESGSVRIENGRIDPGDIDADDADRIIQLALFGEVRFG